MGEDEELEEAGWCREPSCMKGLRSNITWKDKKIVRYCDARTCKAAEKKYSKDKKSSSQEGEECRVGGQCTINAAHKSKNACGDQCDGWTPCPGYVAIKDDKFKIEDKTLREAFRAAV